MFYNFIVPSLDPSSQIEMTMSDLDGIDFKGDLVILNG